MRIYISDDANQKLKKAAERRSQSCEDTLVVAVDALCKTDEERSHEEPAEPDLPKEPD